MQRSETVRWTANLPIGDFAVDYDFVCLRHPDEYPMNEGRLVSSGGLDIASEEYADHFEEYQVPHSNALHSRRRNATGESGAYFVGPLARWSLNEDRGSPLVREAAAATGISLATRNPFLGIVARSLEVVLAFEEALQIISTYEPPAKPAVDFAPCAGIGQAITEAPRGILYHRYETDAAGLLKSGMHHSAHEPEPVANGARPDTHRSPACRAAGGGSRAAGRVRHPQLRPLH